MQEMLRVYDGAEKERPVEERRKTKRQACVVLDLVVKGKEILIAVVGFCNLDDADSFIGKESQLVDGGCVLKCANVAEKNGLLLAADIRYTLPLYLIDVLAFHTLTYENLLATIV